jgi:hypothetical protein
LFVLSRLDPKSKAPATKLAGCETSHYHAEVARHVERRPHDYEHRLARFQSQLLLLRGRLHELVGMRVHRCCRKRSTEEQRLETSFHRVSKLN